eukprot:CAMPEP_0195094880 /NCGR_PEP_ID=MMETSP0448-20130528/46508_1 /TAXON_ID=66468 /ORGANISM="Heterocapsa triquestra, Strain CCMP 448" /LENGTH=63 /DNA_ID=CAMNT_0040128977 /DNA_START=1 /DNA_END=188 /DNA_ORIENTATION=-
MALGSLLASWPLNQGDISGCLVSATAAAMTPRSVHAGTGGMSRGRPYATQPAGSRTSAERESA